MSNRAIHHQSYAHNTELAHFRTAGFSYKTRHVFIVIQLSVIVH